MSELLTLFGTIVTCLGTWATLWQAKKVERYKEQVAFDLRKISISEASENLRRAQEDCRKILNPYGRGQSLNPAYNSIQERIDIALGKFGHSGPDSDIREKTFEAHELLTQLRSADSAASSANDLHVCIQYCISMCNERISQIS